MRQVWPALTSASYGALIDLIFPLDFATSRLHPTPQYVHIVRTVSVFAIDFDSKISLIALVGQACAHAPQLTQSLSAKLASKLLMKKYSAFESLAL